LNKTQEKIMSNLSFDIQTSVFFFNDLKEEYAVYRENIISSRIAINCALRAWHLTEWIYKEYNLCTQFFEIHLYQKHIKSECPSLQIMQDISNGSKHFMITKYPPHVKNTELQEGCYDPNYYHRDYYDVPALKIELKDGRTLYFEDEIQNVMDYWENYFSTELNVSIKAQTSTPIPITPTTAGIPAR
jgi:hypothetical protein